MEKLIQTLEDKSFKEAQKYIDEVLIEAAKIKENKINEVKSKNQKRYENYQKEAESKKQQEITKISMKAQNETNHLKEMYVNQVIEECKEYYKHLSTDEYIELIVNTLEKHEAIHEPPRLLVCERYYVDTKEALGKQYQVLSKPELKSGFILSYKTYNINYEMDQIFQFHHQEFSRKVLLMLFGEGLNES